MLTYRHFQAWNLRNRIGKMRATARKLQQKGKRYKSEAKRGCCKSNESDRV